MASSSSKAVCAEATEDAETVPDTRDKKPSSTIKRNLDFELSRSELMEMLVHMEGELEARELALAALKADKFDLNVRKFRYGCFSSFHHDSILVADDGNWETEMKSMYAKQLALLDNLIQTQHKTQHKTRMQLAALEKQYHKVCAELEHERSCRKDMPEPDGRTIHRLEDEKEAVTRELEFERNRNVKLEEDVRLISDMLGAAKAEAIRHEKGAAIIAKERKWFAGKISKMAEMIDELEKLLEEECKKSLQLSSDLSNLNSRLKSSEEKHLNEMTAERQLCNSTVDKKDFQLRELHEEVDRLKSRLWELEKMVLPGNLNTHHQTSSVPVGVDSSAVSCSVTFPFPLNPAATGIDATDRDRVKDDDLGVTFALQTDMSSRLEGLFDVGVSENHLTSSTNWQKLPPPSPVSPNSQLSLTKPSLIVAGQSSTAKIPLSLATPLTSVNQTLSIDRVATSTSVSHENHVGLARPSSVQKQQHRDVTTARQQHRDGTVSFGGNNVESPSKKSSTAGSSKIPQFLGTTRNQLTHPLKQDAITVHSSGSKTIPATEPLVSDTNQSLPAEGGRE